jgi:hypothetical protein
MPRLMFLSVSGSDGTHENSAPQWRHRQPHICASGTIMITWTRSAQQTGHSAYDDEGLGTTERSVGDDELFTLYRNSMREW